MAIFVDRELSRRLEQAEGQSGVGFVEVRRRIAPQIGAEWRELEGTYAMFDGAGSPLTQTFGLGMSAPVTPALLTELERFFAERGADTDHEVSPLAGVEALALLAARGYRPIELSAVLVRPLDGGGGGGGSGGGGGGSGDDTRPAPGLTVRACGAGEAERERYIATAVAGWAEPPAPDPAGTLEPPPPGRAEPPPPGPPEPPEPGPPQPGPPELAALFEAIARAAIQRPETASFLVEREGEPIATGSLSVHGGVALLAGASTIPARRGLGAQGLLLAARLEEARRRGCQLAMMVAAPGGTSQRNAERRGFRVAYTRTKWRLHPPAP